MKQKVKKLSLNRVFLPTGKKIEIIQTETGKGDNTVFVLYKGEEKI